CPASAGGPGGEYMMIETNCIFEFTSEHKCKLPMRFSEIKAHLGKFRIGIAGAGGLGSNCAVALARSGIGTLVISDFDTVEPANLNRQYFFTNQVGMMKTEALKEILLRINPDTVVIAHTEKLNAQNIPVIFAGCDIVVEAFDVDKMKEMLIETIQIKMPGIPIIIGSGLAGWGNNETIKCRMIDDTLYVCGDESTEADAELPPMAPRVGIVANMQANMVIDLLMKKTKDYFQI
ncbi:MAG: sulfur carrier protein ThiS adenylyltransferase, partial [Bacteroidota bacterium]|nr:sulfur carrier protein ThiS adenylyltransferase [Bacteroidota bacterium]